MGDSETVTGKRIRGAHDHEDDGGGDKEGAAGATPGKKRVATGAIFLRRTIKRSSGLVIAATRAFRQANPLCDNPVAFMHCLETVCRTPVTDGSEEMGSVGAVQVESVVRTSRNRQKE